MCHRPMLVISVLVSLATPSLGQVSELQTFSRSSAGDVKLSEDQRKELLAKRDAFLKQSKIKQEERRFEESLKLLDEVYALESEIFGTTHEELLGTLDMQLR